MPELRALVAFYSRTGTTKKAAQAIADALQSDIEEIHDTKDRSGALGYLGAAKDAVMKRSASIEEPAKDPAAYDVVIVGTPVWAFTMSAPVRAYLEYGKTSLPNVAFFCTKGNSGSERTFAAMEGRCGKSPIAVLSLKEGVVRKAKHLGKVGEFIARIKAHFGSD